MCPFLRDRHLCLPNSSPACPEPAGKPYSLLQSVHNLPTATTTPEPISPCRQSVLFHPRAVGCCGISFLYSYTLNSFTTKMTKYTTTLAKENSPGPTVP